MTAPAPADQFVVTYGKSAALGVFTAAAPLALSRGTPVVVQTPRGVEFGSILGPASLRQARLLGAVSSGTLLRPATAADQQRQAEQAQCAGLIFETARAKAAGLPLDVLDVDLLFDGQVAIVQVVGTDGDYTAFAQGLEQSLTVAVRLENLAVPMAPDEPEHAGCGKPDCGQGEGGCSTCSTGGGCSSCGSAGVPLRDYFAHLRTQMDADRRTPLL